MTAEIPPKTMTTENEIEDGGTGFVERRTLTVEHTTSTAHRLSHYEGDCSNIHGHNLEWEVILSVEVPNEDHNMAIDFKDVSDLLDRYDHAVLLNENDPLLEVSVSNDNKSNEPFQSDPDIEDLLGKVRTFPGDPTCEFMCQYVAEKFVSEFEQVGDANVRLAETQKYEMESGHVWEP